LTNEKPAVEILRGRTLKVEIDCFIEHLRTDWGFISVTLFVCFSCALMYYLYVK